MREYPTLAAVDLGSNSFHLQVARVVGKQLYPLDSLKEMVRLAAGLTRDRKLDEACQTRALDCLKRFGERLRGFPTHAVRVVGTNSLRVAKNAADFLVKAESVLGFPIEIIAGHEEARLIYLGVAHSLPVSENNRLIIDIGGGSTEFIIGTRLEPNKLESLYMGCVSHSLRFFPDGKISKGAMKRAELAAQTEIQSITTEFSADQWQEVYGSSGTARALGRILRLNNFDDGNKTEGITLTGLEAFREYLLKVGDIRKIEIAGLHPDRAPVIVGGFAIMFAAFKELSIPRMFLATGALRQGVLYDMLGRFHNEDMREVSVRQFMQRYRVDLGQAARIESLSLALGKQLLANYPDEETVEDALRLLSWAARLHEIGISVAHSGYHKHSAYILGNADIPGFSKMEQMQLSQLVLAHQGSLSKVSEFLTNLISLAQSIALRLATIFYRSRTNIKLPPMKIHAGSEACKLFISQAWLECNPLTETLLNAEIDAWAALKINFCIQGTSSKEDFS
ncbi:exopolyphosphatase [Nitrosomonas sp. Nm33]|uniref:exopolyphosphatase n=1 Tax=Nitrosomonas sp. Nm33 TaxID=133724 RepID=UPI00089BFDE4|nr:exopolyphosphatase [Nitrosomonas sp. Nm33]SDY37939.1 exopolyphosphatase / guanosine-5'-triphosphate,3'-diphosphate pyrophosphatase [Nitrosomonas sp. Nm33]